MKKIFKLLFVLILLMIVFLGCKSYDNLKNREIDVSSKKEVNKQKNKLQVAVFEFKPYMTVKDENYLGPSIDIVREIFKRIGYAENIDYEFVVYPWARTLQYAKLGDVDMILQILKSEEREEYLIYTKEYHVKEEFVLLKKENSEMVYDGKIENLKEFKIGVVNGFKYGEKFDKAIEEELIEVDKSKDSYSNIEKLINDRVDGVLELKEVSDQILEELGHEKNISKEKIYTNYSYIAFSKKSELNELRKIFDEKLIELRKDKTEEKIYQRYFLEK